MRGLCLFVNFRFAITITFLILYLQANELFPTSLRSSGNSFCGTVGSVIGIFGPSIVYLVSDLGITPCSVCTNPQISAILTFPFSIRFTGFQGRFYAGAPYLAMAIMSLTGLLVTAFLPETLHQHLPETIEDADAFGKEHQFWSLHPKRRKSEINVQDINNFLARRRSLAAAADADNFSSS